MLKRLLLAVPAAIAASPAAIAQPATSAEASVSVPREVLERYVGLYELNGTTVTIGVTDDGRLTSQLAGQPAGPPLRTVSANEFSADAVGVRISFEGEGPKATRIRSLYQGSVVVGTRLAEGAAGPAPQPATGAPLDAAARQAVVTQLGSALRDRYVFPDIGQQAAARIDAALAAGEYDSLDHAAFAARLHAHVEAIAHDKHLRINWQGGPGPVGGPPAGAAPPPMPRGEAGVVRADKLAGDIGYIEVVGFPPPPVFKPALDRAMAGLAGSKALIIDVRRNGGGAPPAVAYLVSYLLAAEPRVHINTIVGRTAGTTEFTRQDFHSEPTPVSFAGVPVYVLTSSYTFSGGEEFAYDVKALKLATLVGELTGGGANPTGGVQLGNGFGASIPFGRAENPVTGTNWEGHGVDPDVAVPAADALGTALERLGHAPAADIAAASHERVFAPRSEPAAGTEAALRGFIAGLQSGNPDYDTMAPPMADVVRQQLPRMQANFSSLGELKSVTFREPGMMGGDAYDVVFANGGLTMAVMLGADGKLVGSQVAPLAPAGS